MNTKTTLVLALVGAAVFAYLLFVEKPWEEQQVVDAQPKTIAKALFELPADEVDRVELDRRAGKKFVFVKEDDNEWKMLEPLACPANKQEVDNLVKKVAEAKYLKRYAAGSKDVPSDKIAGLEELRARVKLFKGDKVEAEVEVAFGGRVPTGKGSYLRVAGSDDVIEAQDDFGDTFTKKVKDYRNKTIVKFDLKDVQRVSVEGTANFVLVKNGDRWVVESPVRGVADKSRAVRVARALSNLNVSDFKDDEPVSYRPYGLDKPRLTLKVETLETKPAKAKPGDPDTKPADTQPSIESQAYVLHIGGPAKPDAKEYFARIGSAPWVFVVPENKYNDINADLVELRDKTLAKVESAKVKKIVGDIAGETIALTKGPNGNWVFADEAETQADATVVGDLLKAIGDLKASDFIDPAQLLMTIDWDKPRAKIAVTQEGRLEPITVLVGPASPSGKMVYVRNAASDAVAVVRDSDVEQLMQMPVSYRDRTVMTFERDRANQIAVSGKERQTITLAKGGDGKSWRMSAPIMANVDRDAVRNLLQDLSSLQAKRVVSVGDKAAYGLDKPQVELAVWVEPVTAKPKAKVVKKGGETQPAAAELASSQPGDDIQKRIATLEEMLEYQKNNPDQEKPELTEMIKKQLAELKEKAATQPATAAQPTAAEVEETPKQPTVLRLYLAQRGGKTYGCLSDGDMVYELDERIFADATAEFHERQITKFEVADVVEVTFGGKTPLVFRKDGDAWKYALDPVLPIDKQKVTDALNDIRELKTEKYVSYSAADPGTYGLGAEAGRIAVKLNSGQQVEVLVSKDGPQGDANNSRYAMLANTKKVFLLSGEVAGKCERKLEDFEKGGS